MRRFGEKFHPGDSIGFAYGLHHDTDNLHAHVALCPRTANGRYVGCSTSRSSQSRHKKQMDMIYSWFERENQHWEKILQSPEKIVQTISHRLDSDRIVFTPRLNIAQLEILRSNQTAEAVRLQQSYHSIRSLEAAIAGKRQVLNLIVLFADEGQEIITGAESAFADHRAAGVIREARATIVLATQAYTSILGSLDKRHAEVLMLNLSNELIFTVANQDSAVIASKNIGEREVVEKSLGWAGGKKSYNYQRKIKPFFEPYRLRKLLKVTAIIRHCEKPFRKRLIPPIKPDGSFPQWFVRTRPIYALLKWFRGKTHQPITQI